MPLLGLHVQHVEAVKWFYSDDSFLEFLPLLSFTAFAGLGDMKLKAEIRVYLVRLQSLFTT